MPFNQTTHDRPDRRRQDIDGHALRRWRQYLRGLFDNQGIVPAIDADADNARAVRIVVPAGDNDLAINL